MKKSNKNGQRRLRFVRFFFLACDSQDDLHPLHLMGFIVTGLRIIKGLNRLLGNHTGMKKHNVTKFGRFYLNRFTFVGLKNNRVFLI